MNLEYSKDHELELSKILSDCNCDKCKCGKKIDFNDIDIMNGIDDDNYDYALIEIKCKLCDFLIIQFPSWMGFIKTVESLFKILKEDLEDELYYQRNNGNVRVK